MPGFVTAQPPRRGGPEPRAATRRCRFGAEHGEHGEDRSGAAARLRGAEGGVEPARRRPALQWEISR